MKFKTIFILFNAILIFSFAFIFLMPFLLLGGGYTMQFWLRNWPLFLFFAAVLFGFNAFFVSNWKLFSLLESENWDALASMLSVKVFEKKKYDKRTIRLLVNTSLLRGDMDTVQRLETALRTAKPVALRRDAVLFGSARLIKNDTAESERFLSEFADGKGVENPSWISFYYAFTLVLRKKASDAAPLLEKLLGAKDPVLALLSAYILGTLCSAAAEPPASARMNAAAESRRVELGKRFNVRTWAREAERAKSEIHVVILSKILDEAGAWLFPAVAL